MVRRRSCANCWVRGSASCAGHVHPGDLPCDGRHGFAIWWLTSLNGLPDIGDPFDVAAFRAFRVPDDQNAFTFLRRAKEALTPGSPPCRRSSWSEASPKSREWVEANRRAIELFQQGAEQSDAANPCGDSVVDGQRLALLVLLEGEKRLESGDMAGAWDCNRAVLRMATHTRRRGSLRQRQDLDAYWYGLLRQRLDTWAADPRTTIPQLRTRLGRSAHERAKARVGFVCDKSGISRNDALAGAADLRKIQQVGRSGIYLSPWRHAVVA